MRSIRRSPFYFLGRQGMQPRAALAGWWQWEVLVRNVEASIEQALGWRNGRRVRWSEPASSPWPRQAGVK